MAHHRNKRPDGPSRAISTGYCEACNKIRYNSKADAKKAASQQGPRQRVYPCPVDGQFFHRTSWGPAGRVAYYREHGQ